MKFVVHAHDAALPHYDFMLERGHSLGTWRIDAGDLPRLERGETVTAERIGDHRREYLEYEGPVSCDRGTVRMYDSGEYRVLHETDDALEVALEGKLLHGTMLIAGGDRSSSCTFSYRTSGTTQ